MDGFILVIEDDEPRLRRTEAAGACIEIGSRRGEKPMQVTGFLRSLFMRVAIAAVAIWFVDPTRAATFATSPGSFALGDETRLAPVADTFMFRSGTGVGFESASFLTTGYAGRSDIFNVNGATFFDPIASSQAEAIDIAATSPVPEPHANVLLLNGAVLLAWQLYRRRMKKRDAGR